MTHVRVTIDGDTVMDDKIGNWQASPPDFLREIAQPGAKPESYMKAVAITLADALLMGVDTAIDVTTNKRGWSMSSKKLIAAELTGGGER